ncbi:MAG: phospholipid carrier-dependent glycosyltransferase [Patescibacteria group bacterium]
MRKYLPIIIIAAVSLIVHFAYFGQPKETVFDEVHFGKFISGYFTGNYFFDIHPPLGKLLLSGMGWLGGFQPGFSFTEIGQQFPDNIYLWLRFLPTLAGALLPVVIFYLALQLGLSRLAAFAAGMLVALDNALLTQSRYILLDSFLLLFGFAALLFYTKYWRSHNLKPKTYHLFLAGVLGALAVSVKWTGGTFLAIIVFFEIIKLLKNKNFQSALKPTIFLLVIPFVIYFSIFAVHLKLLTKSGPGDAFMTPTFQKTLAGNPQAGNLDIEPASLFQKFIELNLQMYSANARLTAGHPYSSQWYTWPFMARPVYYWNETLPGNQINYTPARIYFLGNPVVWWGSTVAVLYFLLTLIPAFSGNRDKEKLAMALLGAYFLNLLPFIGIKRAMFLYHYLTALIFAILILVYLVDKLPARKKIFTGLLLAGLVSFIYFAPLSYGLPISEPAYNARVWFPSWR